MGYAIGTALVATIESVVSCDVVASHWQQRLTKTDNNKRDDEDEGGSIVVSSPIATAFTVSAEIRHSVAKRVGSLSGWQARPNE
jgi:hypothetical protein